MRAHEPRRNEGEEGLMTQVIEPKAIQPISLPEISKRVSLSKILVTTDFSPESDRALAYALALARRYDARIYLAHVLVPDAFLYAERSEEHTSELQSRVDLVCRLLLEKKKENITVYHMYDNT